MLDMRVYTLRNGKELIFNDVSAMPDFGGNGDYSGNLNLFKSKMKTNCKIIYSESKVNKEVNGNVVQEEFRGETYSTFSGTQTIRTSVNLSFRNNHTKFSFTVSLLFAFVRR